jgi:hypothetical protein
MNGVKNVKLGTPGLTKLRLTEGGADDGSHKTFAEVSAVGCACFERHKPNCQLPVPGISFITS